MRGAAREGSRRATGRRPKSPAASLPARWCSGCSHYWLGLRQLPYRTWLLPSELAQPGYSPNSIGLDEALERVNPSVLLIDRDIDDLMTKGLEPADPNHRPSAGFDAFMFNAARSCSA